MESRRADSTTAVHGAQPRGWGEVSKPCILNLESASIREEMLKSAEVAGTLLFRVRSLTILTCQMV